MTRLFAATLTLASTTPLALYGPTPDTLLSLADAVMFVIIAVIPGEPAWEPLALMSAPVAIGLVGLTLFG